MTAKHPPLKDGAIRRAGPQDVVWIAQTHGMLYRRDEGFDDSFEPLVTTVLNGFMADHDAKRERGWIMMHAGERAGSLFCTQVSQDIAKLRLFLLLPALRGRGIGHALLRNAMGFAKDAGYLTLQVSTYDRHAAACALYRRAGFALTDARPARAFGHAMIEQTWQIALSQAAPCPK